MELWHNQVTRVQGPFSLRMFHRSWGLMLIQVNLQAPCMLLDFPTLDRFIEEIRDQEYDIVGISSIVPNLHKVETMCQLVRRYRPGATIVVGGHIANIPDLAARIDADHVVRGDGVSAGSAASRRAPRTSRSATRTSMRAEHARWGSARSWCRRRRRPR